MGKIMIGCIASVAEIDCGIRFRISSIDHFAKRAVFISFPARLNYKVSESPIKNGIQSIDMYLVKPFCRLAIRLKKVSESSGFL